MTLRKVEVFTAGCSLCDDAVQLVQKLTCPSCTVEVLDMCTATDFLDSRVSVFTRPV